MKMKAVDKRLLISDERKGTGGLQRMSLNTQKAPNTSAFYQSIIKESHVKWLIHLQLLDLSFGEALSDSYSNFHTKFFLMCY